MKYQKLGMMNHSTSSYEGDILKNLLYLTLTLVCACGSASFKTVDSVDLPRFMGDWYVLGGRFTFLEKDVYNGLESYTFNEDKKRIDIAFHYNKGSFDGETKSIPQKGWVENEKTNAHWKVQPLWPLKFDYLIVDLDPNYQWTAIGVPDQKYLWIMARDWKTPEATMKKVVESLNRKGYDTKNLVLVPHRH
ncbi:MAG: lipocalin family protein [Bdellovibrionaceae bacterium]|nr:lipocalin family protein [Pseudobdellovibrionaceae bacterium]